LRLPDSTDAAAMTMLRAVLARAAFDVIRSAVCAIRVPKATMIAAKIIMLRMNATPGETTGRYHHIRRQAATNGRGEGCHFGEKDE
jgi:hypothetical protein